MFPPKDTKEREEGLAIGREVMEHQWTKQWQCQAPVTGDLKVRGHT